MELQTNLLKPVICVVLLNDLLHRVLRLEPVDGTPIGEAILQHWHTLLADHFQWAELVGVGEADERQFIAGESLRDLECFQILRICRLNIFKV